MTERCWLAGTPAAQTVSVSAKVGTPVSLAGQRFTVQIPSSQAAVKSGKTPAGKTTQIPGAKPLFGFVFSRREIKFAVRMWLWNVPLRAGFPSQHLPVLRVASSRVWGFLARNARVPCCVIAWDVLFHSGKSNSHFLKLLFLFHSHTNYSNSSECSN